MPKTLWLPGDAPTDAGIDVTWYKTRGELRIGGWYDTHVGIKPAVLSLREFFDRLGITEKDCRRAFAEGSNE